MHASTPSDEAALRQRLTRARHDRDALAGLVSLLAARGDLAQAAQYLARLCEASPELPSFRLDLARLHLQANAPRDALLAARRALQAGADPFAAQCLLAEAAERCGLLPDALDATRAALALQPGTPALHNNLGLLLRRTGMLPAALDAFEAALGIVDAPVGTRVSTLNNRGNTFRMMGRLEEALADYDLALSLDPARVDAHHNRGLVLLQLNRPHDAIAAFDVVLTRYPSDPDSTVQKAEALIAAGDFASADEILRSLLSGAPRHARAWYLRATLARTADAATAMLSSVEHLSRVADLSPAERSQLDFAAGDLRDRIGDPDGAFKAYRTANRFARNLHTRNEREHVSRIVQEILDIDISRWTSAPLLSDVPVEPIFIIGMPRSGTTLVEQVLSVHPAVSAAGEADFFGPALHWQTVGRADRPAVPAILALGEAERIAIRERYLIRLRGLCGATTGHVSDKTPLNFLYAGFLRALFPSARFVHCRRDARDTCLSIYFQQFGSLAFTHDLQDIARAYEAYLSLMDYWRTSPAFSFFDVTYESLVTDPEPTIRALLEFLRLPWASECLAPHVSSHPVNTASRWQARQPVHREAIARWRRYARQLGALGSLPGD
ncbi:MAG: sulfotransferase [Gammaproteobacteria bacterium]